MKTPPVIEFQSDKVLLSGPRADGSYRVSFEVGEYQLSNIKDLVEVRDAVLGVSVSVEHA